MFVSDHLSDRRLFATVDESHLASMRILEKLDLRGKNSARMSLAFSISTFGEAVSESA